MANTSQPNASHIGNSFVLRYYTQLSEKPENLFHFYKENSTFTHGQEDEEITESVVGAENINNKIQTLGFKNCHVTLSVVDCQESQDQGILIVVLGFISNNGGSYRKFIQTFFLARGPGATGGVYYFVLNDVFRYLKQDQNAPVTQDDVSTKPQSSNVDVAPQNETVAPVKKVEEPPKVEVAEKKAEPVHVEKKAEVKPASKPQETTTTTPTQQPAAQQSTKPTSNKKNDQKKKNNQQQQQQQASTQQSSQQPAQAQSSTPSWANMASRLQGGIAPQVAPQQAAKPAAAPTTTPVAQTPAAPATTPAAEQPASPVNKPSNVKAGNTKDKSLKEGHSLYVSSLPFTVTEEEIRSTFVPFGGDIKHIVVNKGYCFIEYSSAEAVQNVLKAASARPIVIGGRDLMIEEKRPNNNNKKQFKDGSKKPRDDNNRGGDRRGDNRKPRSNNTNQNEEKKPKKPFHKENINSPVSSNPTPNL